MKKLIFPTDRLYDLACLGRLAVDFYGETIGVGLENTPSFNKYLGGSSANVAFGTARLGLKSAMISRVGNEQMGQFLTQTLENEGCDTSQVSIDPERLTGLVLLALKDQEQFPLLFYRRDCADMALSADDIDTGFIKQCKALAITGTHLSTEKVLSASRKALLAAREAGTKTVLDIDYRPVLWGLTNTGDGETRYIADDGVSKHLQEQLPLFDLIIGTEEEFMIAGGIENDVIGSLKKAREVTEGIFVLKRGALGCQIYDGAIPDDIDELPIYAGERIEVMNVLGAGDAFASGLLYGLIRGKSYEEATRIANVCGAIVVSRHGCAPAMPTYDELNYWLNKEDEGGSRPDLDEHLQHLHCVSLKRKTWDEVCVLAFDHRSQFEDLAKQYGYPLQNISKLKDIIFAALQDVEANTPTIQGKLGLLADNAYAKQVLADATERNPQWWIGRPVEQPGSRPLRFDGMDSVGSHLATIPREQTVKCLVFYHPEDAQNLRLEQEKRVLELWEAVKLSGHELLLEVIAPREMPASVSDTDEDSIILRSVARFYALGVKPHWWKLAGMREASWQQLADLIAQHDPYCRGAVMLGLNQPEAELIKHFKAATHPIVKGFMIGRSVWQAPLAQLLNGDIDETTAQAQISHNFSNLITAWLNRKS